MTSACPADRAARICHSTPAARTRNHAPHAQHSSRRRIGAQLRIVPGCRLAGSRRGREPPQCARHHHRLDDRCTASAGGDKILFTTGRLTGEMVIKAAQSGVPIVVSRNGVSAMGYDLAAKLRHDVVRPRRQSALSCATSAPSVSTPIAAAASHRASYCRRLKISGEIVTPNICSAVHIVGASSAMLAFPAVSLPVRAQLASGHRAASIHSTRIQ